MQQVDQKSQVIDFVKGLDLSKLERPIDKSKMMEQLHIENPLVGDLVTTWMELRKRRMQMEKQAEEMTRRAKSQLTKFHQEVERQEAKDEKARMAGQAVQNTRARSCDEGWEDEVSDEDAEQYELEGRLVSRKDIINIMEFAMTTQLLNDQSRLTFDGIVLALRKGKVAIPKDKYNWRLTRQASRAKKISRWSTRLLKDSDQLKNSAVTPRIFARQLLRNLIVDKKIKLSSKRVKAVIKQYAMKLKTMPPSFKLQNYQIDIKQK